jgi:hypothetical protein
MDDFFAQPTWNVREQLLNLKRQLRCTALIERGDDYQFEAKTVLRLSVQGDVIEAQLALRPAQQPQWSHWQLKAAPDMRQLLQETKKRLAKWSEE